MFRWPILNLLLISSCLSAPMVRAEESLCNDLLSGISTDIRSSIQDLAKLRYDLDVRSMKGLHDFMTRTMIVEFDRKWIEVLNASGLRAEVLSSVIRSEIQKIQPLNEIEKKALEKKIQEEVGTRDRIEKIGSVDLRGRFSHTQTLLPDDRVLIAGGRNRSGLFSRVEIIDPNTGRLEAIGSLKESRDEHAESALPDGRVFLSAGVSGQAQLSSIEMIDLRTRKIEVVGNLNEKRKQHAQTTLSDGRLLIVGGWNKVYLGSIEVFDPKDGSVKKIGELNQARAGQAQGLLPDGRVLVMGGFTKGTFFSSVEVIDPSTGVSQKIGDLIHARSGHQFTVLSDDRLLIAGGFASIGYDELVPEIEIFDLSTGKSEVIGELNHPRFRHGQSLLPDGQVLVSGGVDEYALASVELIDPVTGHSETVLQLNDPRSGHTQIVRSDGSVLVIGGNGRSLGSSISIEHIRVRGK